MLIFSIRCLYVSYNRAATLPRVLRTWLKPRREPQLDACQTARVALRVQGSPFLSGIGKVRTSCLPHSWIGTLLGPASPVSDTCAEHPFRKKKEEEQGVRGVRFVAQKKDAYDMIRNLLVSKPGIRIYVRCPYRYFGHYLICDGPDGGQ